MNKSIETMERKFARRANRNALLARRASAGAHQVQEETLITDSRIGLRPAQAVEQKLKGKLQQGALQLSSFTTTTLFCNRKHC